MWSDILRTEDFTFRTSLANYNSFGSLKFSTLGLNGLAKCNLAGRGHGFNTWHHMEPQELKGSEPPRQNHE